MALSRALLVVGEALASPAAARIAQRLALGAQRGVGHEREPFGGDLFFALFAKPKFVRCAIEPHERAVDARQLIGFCFVALGGERLEHLVERLFVFVLDADDGRVLAIRLDLVQALGERLGAQRLERGAKFVALLGRHLFFPRCSRSAKVPSFCGPPAVGGGASSSPGSASASEMRRRSRSTASTVTRTACPSLTASRACLSGRPAPSSLTCTKPSTPAASSTIAPNVSTRTTFPGMCAPSGNRSIASSHGSRSSDFSDSAIFSGRRGSSLFSILITCTSMTCPTASTSFGCSTRANPSWLTCSIPSSPPRSTNAP